MRKMIVAVLSMATLIPAVALAADAATSPADQPAAAAGGGDRALALRGKQRRANLKHARQRARERARRRARAHRHAAKAAAANRSTASPTLQAIAACESGGNPKAVGGGGTYRGKYQFDQATWASVGGSGDPAAASVAEQDRRAAMLYARVGRSAWPVCGH